MDLICSCVEIFRFVLCRGEEDGPETKWSQQYGYLGETRTTASSTQLPFKTQSNVSKSSANTTTNTSHQNVSKTPSLLDRGSTSWTSTSQKVSEVSPKPRGFLSSSSVSQKQSEVSTKPRDFLSSSSVSQKQSEVSTKPRDFLSSSSGSQNQSEVSTKPRDFLSSSSVSQKQSEVSTKPRDFLSSSSVSQKQSEVSIKQIDFLPLSSFSQKLSEVSQNPSCQSSYHTTCFLQNNKTNTTGENKNTIQKCSHQISSPSSQPSHKLPLSNTTKPPPSPSSPVPKKPALSTKPALFKDPSCSTNHNAKPEYLWVEKGASPTYATPEDIKGLIEKDIVPEVLKKPLSISTYKDYFRALLYAEDCYLEKWDEFEMENVTLELQNAAIYKTRSKLNRFDEDDKKDEKTFVTFEIDKVPERRPFLLSRDFVSLRPSKKNFQLFKGLVYRVVKSNLLLAEFGEDFHAQHRPACKYDVKFSFNRVCLKRAHQAIESVSGPLFRNFLFPEFLPENRLLSKHFFAYKTLDWEQYALDKILRLQASPPYLVKGPISVTGKCLSKTGNLIVAAVVELCQASPLNRILLCAPVNKTCDLILRGLKKQIPKHDMFRANAAFREWDGVPVDILPSCLYENETECFSCPSLDELCRYKVILSTFMSSYRLHNEGVRAGHFSHIFLVDASSATEPEALVPLANFATKGTVAVVIGAPRNHSGWIRSPMARKFGLACSYFQRLSDCKLYMSLDPNVITVLKDEHQN